MKINRPCIDLCTGFLQSTRKTNGMDALADKLHDINDLRVGRPLAWDSDPIGNAKWVLDNVANDMPYSIVAYSYGANTGLNLCRELQKHGRSVDYLYLIDGVKRLRTAKFSWIAKVWSLNPYLRLIIPSNVRHYTIWRQNQRQPKGHRVYRTLLNGSTEEIPTIWKNRPHTEMEDDAQIHSVIEKEMRIRKDINLEGR